MLYLCVIRSGIRLPGTLETKQWRYVIRDALTTNERLELTGHIEVTPFHFPPRIYQKPLKSNVSLAPLKQSSGAT